MKISEVLKMESGQVVCLENRATITVSKNKGEKSFTSTFPVDSAAMPEEQFVSFYKDKHFKPVDTAKKSNSKSE